MIHTHILNKHIYNVDDKLSLRHFAFSYILWLSLNQRYYSYRMFVSSLHLVFTTTQINRNSLDKVIILSLSSVILGSTTEIVIRIQSEVQLFTSGMYHLNR